jgi:hypothetical protein
MPINYSAKWLNQVVITWLDHNRRLHRSDSSTFSPLFGQLFCSVLCKLSPSCIFWIHFYHGEFSLSFALFAYGYFYLLVHFNLAVYIICSVETVVSNQISLHKRKGKVVTTKVASKLHPKSEKWKFVSLIVRDRRRFTMGRINNI